MAWYATAERPDAYENFALMVSPPAAFFILGGMIWVFNMINKKA
jgi:Na+-transporting NADH:ubiquinone oxidoreductase subunit D